MSLPDERIDEIAEIAAQLAARVRDETPQANRRWLLSKRLDADEMEALVFILAAAIPLDVGFRRLVGWVHVPRPCLTPRQAQRQDILVAALKSAPAPSASRDRDPEADYDDPTSARPDSSPRAWLADMMPDAV